MTTSIRYNDPLPLAVADTAPAVVVRPRRTGLIIGIIVAVIVVIIIIVVVVIVVLRSRRRPTNPNNNNPGGGGNNPPVTTCTTNAQCPAPRVCNVAAQRCVDCLTNAQCAGGAFPICRTDNNTCVRCVASSDCPPNSTCSNNVCCDSSPPTISNITTSNGPDPRVQLNLDIKQPVATSRILVVLEDPTGFPLLNKFCDDVRGSGGVISCTAAATCPEGDQCVEQKCLIPSCMTFAAGAFVLLIQSSIGIKLFTGANYRVRVKVVYDCGSIRNASTAFSAVQNFTMAPCPTLTVPLPISFFEEVVITGGGGLRLALVVALPFPNESSPGVPAPDFLVGFVVGLTSGFHPNRALFIIEEVQTTNGPDGFKVVTLPHPGVGTFFARAFRSGGIDSCDGPLGPEFRFVTRGFDQPNLRSIPSAAT